MWVLKKCNFRPISRYILKTLQDRFQVPRAHINIIVTKAHQRANAVLRYFLSGNVDILKRAFLTYVRPLLEYNSVVWSPFYKQDIEAIERVQRRFSKRLPGLKNLSYEERLKYPGWQWPTAPLTH